MTLLGFAMYSVMRLRVCFSISVGWSPMGTCSSQRRHLQRAGALYLGQTRQINECQAQHVRRVDLEINGLSVDSLVVSCYPRGLVLDLASDLGEVVVSPPRDVQELSPLLLPSNTRWGMRDVNFIVLVGIVAFAGEVDELEDERSSSDDAATSGQEVSTDDVLEHR